MNTNLLLGSPTIDQQHLALFASFETLSAACKSEFPDEILSEVLSRLGYQIRHHFLIEETLMEGLPMPAGMLRAHRAAHERILEELAQIHLDTMHGEASSLESIVSMVAGWVNQHLIEYDLDLKPYLNGSAG